MLVPHDFLIKAVQALYVLDLIVSDMPLKGRELLLDLREYLWVEKRIGWKLSKS